jgi:hypothetical protein
MAENKIKLYQLDQSGAAAGQTVVWDSALSTWIPGGATSDGANLPPQENNQGKYLTTNGNTLSWGNVVTSVGLTSANLIITGSPITSAGNINVELSNTGVSPGTYFSVTVDSAGRVVAANNPTSLGEFGIIDGVTTTGTQNLTNKTLTSPTINGPVVKGEKAVTAVLSTSESGSLQIDLSSAQIFAATIAANSTVTVTFTNPPQLGASQMVMLQLTNGGSGTLIWPPGTKFSNGTAPILTSSGVDLLGVFYNTVLSCYIVFLLGKDIK